MKSYTSQTLADVDWGNFDYGTFNGRMHDGELVVPLDSHPYEPHDTISHRLRTVVYGNRRRIAAIVLERAMSFEAFGDTTISSEIHVYKLTGREPQLVGILDVATPVLGIRFEGAEKILVTSGSPAVQQRFRIVDGEIVGVPQQK